MNKEQRRKYYLKNKDRILLNGKRYVERHKDKVEERKKKWESENKDRLKEYQKKWREKNRQKISEWGKVYRANDKIKETKKEYNRKWKRQYREKHPESHRKKLRFEILKRDNFTCRYCGRKAPDVILQIDHIQPLSREGKRYQKDNLITACSDCNQGKGDVLLSELSQRSQTDNC